MTDEMAEHNNSNDNSQLTQQDKEQNIGKHKPISIWENVTVSVSHPACGNRHEHKLI